MKHFVLRYTVVSDYVDRRGAYRDAHLKHAGASRARGELLLGGALADPVDGAMLLFRAADADTVRAFAETDPYVHAGLVTHWDVREWTTVIGDGAMQPVAVASGSATPVVRVWRGVARAGEPAREYAAHLASSVFPALRALSGFRDVRVLRREVADGVEFIVETSWVSLDAVRAFAGSDVSVAVIEPYARERLVRFDGFASHFDLAN